MDPKTEIAAAEAAPKTKTAGQIKHLEMLQSVISRMASNSFQVKAWCVTLVSALLALAAKEEAKKMVFVAFLPALTFWWLDAFFLHQERLFRALFDKVRENENGIEADFSMDTRRVSKDVDSRAKVMRSKTLRLFYGSLLVVILLGLIMLYFGKLKGWLST